MAEQQSRDAHQARDRGRDDDGNPLDDAPPGSGVINSSRSGQAVSDNPVLRARRDAGDVLADQVREGRAERSDAEEA